VSKIFKYLSFFAVLGCVCVNSGCGTPAKTGDPAAATFPVVVFSDVHFNPYDNPALCPSLAAADVSAWPGLLEGPTTLPAWQQDTNYALLTLALTSIQQNLGKSPVVIFPGDMLGHGMAPYFYMYCEGMTPGQTPTAQQYAAMVAFTDKTAVFVMQQVRSYMGNVPVMFVVGNNDSYTGLGPDSVFLADNVSPYYTNFVNGTAADYPEFFNSLTAGGDYSAEPIGPSLKVISLNSNLFATPSPGATTNPNAAYAELAWLDASLSAAQTAGQKVWLLMHVPPGADMVTSAGNYANNSTLTSATAAMMWVPAYQASFLQILAKYPGMITLCIGAHTHRDEFRLMNAENVLQIPPSISPFFGNDPAFKVYTVTDGTFVPTDYRSVNYDLATAPAGFSTYYTFSSAYLLQGQLDASLEKLYPELGTDSAKRAFYMEHYNSGNNSGTWNPVTDANWPVFFCGMGNMSQTDFMECVNSN
jgi:sphingomyelin phosphodiesterase acid-like 3